MPLARPAEAGRELHSLPPRRRVNRLLLVAFIAVAALGVFLARYGWVYPATLAALYLGVFVYAFIASARQPHLVSICENGLVVENAGHIEWIDWRELASVVYFETFGGSEYDVNAKGAGYRLRQRDLGEQRLEDIIGLVILRTRFQWITETMAARPEILERYRPTRVDPDT